MKQYRIERANIEKLEHQNKATLEDVKEGCLLDNLLYTTKRGFYILKETYQNEWSSIYTLIFSTNADEIEQEWEGIG